MKENGEIISVKRGETMTSEVVAIYQRDEKRFVLFPNEDIRKRDVLINAAGERFFVSTVEVHEAEQGSAALYVYIVAEAERRASPQSATISASVCVDEMRDKAKSSNPADIDELNQVIDLIEELLEVDKEPTRDMFSQFSDVIQRNPWIRESIASVLLSWVL